MKPITEEQFHTVWTKAAYLEGYNKAFFHYLYEYMRADESIIDNPQPAKTMHPIKFGISWFLTLSALVYLCAAFTTLDLNFTHWSFDARGFVATCVGISGVIGMIAGIIRHNKLEGK